MDLSAWRRMHELTQAAAAPKLGVSRPYLTRLEAGQRSPSAEVVRRIVAATDGAVTADELLGLFEPAVLVEAAK